MPRIAGAIVGALLTALVLLSAQPAKADWLLPATSLSAAGQDATDPQVAIGPNGLTTVVWTRNDGSRVRLQSATRLAGQPAFGATIDLTPLAGGDTSSPDIAIGPEGTTVVTYRLDDSGIDVIGVATRPAGSNSFSDGTAPPTVPSLYEAPEVAVGPGGSTTLVWSRLDTDPGSPAPGYVVATSTRESGSGSFSAPVDFSLAGYQSLAPRVATASDGTSTIVYSLIASGYLGLQSVTRPPGAGSFSSVSALSGPGGDADQAQVAVGPGATTAAVWRRQEGSGRRIQASTRGAWPASFTPLSNVSQAGTEVSDPQVALGPEGATTIVWVRSTGSGGIIQAATKTTGSSSFSAPVDISGAGASSPQIAVGPDGETTAVWTRSNGTNTIVQAATRAVGANSFSNPVDLSGTGQNATAPRIAAPLTSTDPCKTYNTTAWQRSNGTNTIIQEASAPLAGCTDPDPTPTPDKAILGRLKVKGPGKTKVGKRATYRVTVANTGGGKATGLKLSAKGRGVKAGKAFGTLAAGKSRTAKVPLRFNKRGKVKVTFTLSSGNAGKKSARKTVKVK